MRQLLFCLFVFTLLGPVQAKVIVKEINYVQDGTRLTGYITYDDALQGKRPGILVVHEWWGHNDYVRSRVRQLAAMGYVAFALDMYGDGKLTEHPKEAGRFAAEVSKNMTMAEARF